MTFTEPKDEDLQKRPLIDFGRDLPVIETYASEVANLFFPKIDYYSVDYAATKASAEFDELYGTSSQTTWSVAQQLPITLEWNPSKKILNQYGIRDDRTLQVKISSSVLRDYGLTPTAGDLIIFDNMSYAILDIIKEGYFGASNKNLIYVLFANTTNTRNLPADALVLVKQMAY